MRAPVLAVGDGALGFWNAKRQVWPETREQRCWFHKLGNVLDKLPKRLQAGAKEQLHEIIFASTCAEAEAAIGRFVAEHGTLHAAAAKCLTDDKEELLAFYDFPEEHWKHLRTTNPIESSFATARLRTRVTKGAGSAGRGGARTPSLGLSPRDTLVSGGTVEPEPIGAEWTFRFHGFMRAPMRVGIDSRDDPGPGMAKTQFHAPPVVPDTNYTRWAYTNNLPGPWAELIFQYGNDRATMTTALASYSLTSGGWRELQAQLGIDRAFLTLNSPDALGDWGALAWNVGVFSNRYGTAGKYDAGAYETYVMARTRSAGETLTTEIDVGDSARVLIEHGIGAKPTGARALHLASGHDELLPKQDALGDQRGPRSHRGHGSRESVAGRFERITLTHWSAASAPGGTCPLRCAPARRGSPCASRRSGRCRFHAHPLRGSEVSHERTGSAERDPPLDGRTEGRVEETGALGDGDEALAGIDGRVTRERRVDVDVEG
jgi:hypothetical protein